MRREATQTMEAPLAMETAETRRCCHHWRIEAPDGPISRGVCRLCGEHREFANSRYGMGDKPEGGFNRSR